MPERRRVWRADATDRRSFPRPPLWLNLLLILLGAGGLLFAQQHRKRVATEFSSVLTEQQRTPKASREMKEQLSTLAENRQKLEQELDGRMKFLASLKSENFYLSIDTQQKKLRFYYGDTVLREGDVTIGQAANIKAPHATWTFVPLKGAFGIEGKAVDFDWKPPEWAYAMNGQAVPANPPVVRDGLGKFVIFLPNGYVIHTQPSSDSPLKGAKPGSFLVDEDFLNAIWPRIHKGTQVYIF